MQDYTVTLVTDEQPPKSTRVYINRPDAFALARRRAGQTKLAQRIWVRRRAHYAWEKLTDIGPDGRTIEDAKAEANFKDAVCRGREFLEDESNKPGDVARPCPEADRDAGRED